MKSRDEILSKIKEFEKKRNAGSATIINNMKLISMEIALEWAAGIRDEIPDVVIAP